MAANETIVRCRSFFNCPGVRAGNELALAARKVIFVFYHVSLRFIHVHVGTRSMVPLDTILLIDLIEIKDLIV